MEKSGPAIFVNLPDLHEIAVLNRGTRVFQQSDPDHDQLIGKIPSALDARTAGYAAKIGRKGRDRFYLAVPGRQGHSAEVWIFQAQE